MATTRQVRAKGANAIVESYAEVLFQPQGQIGRWNRKFMQTLKSKTRKAAPSNKRPRWAHHGVRLKDSIKTSKRARFYPTRTGARLYAAVGATAPHAYYVDQGTGPYEAKILPPWREGSASLYEHTWKVPTVTDRAGGGTAVFWREIGTIPVKGQRAQNFFATGLTKAFRAMRLQQSIAAPPGFIKSGPGGFRVEGTLNFDGGTKDDGKGGRFRNQLELWREWRDESWYSGKILGRNSGIGSAEWVRRLYRDRQRGLDKIARRNERLSGRRARDAERQRTYRKSRQKTAQTKVRKGTKTLTAEKRADIAALKYMAEWLTRNPGGKINNYNERGFNYTIRKGGRVINKGQPWPIGIADLYFDAGYRDGDYDKSLLK